jgi:hypothetical protein
MGAYPEMPPADNPVVNEVIASEAVTTFSDGTSTEFFVVNVDPVSHELVTMEFYEKRRDLGEMRLLKQVNWAIVVPQDARVFMPTSGLLRDQLDAVWVGWRTAEKLSAMSMYQEFPIDVSLDASTKLINPPIILPSKKMVQYFWLPKDETWTLFKYEFHGGQREKGTVTRERIRQAGSEPILSAASPAFGAENDQAAVAWLEQTDAGIKAVACLFLSDSSEILETPAIPYVKPLQRQRMATYADQAGGIRVAFVAESRIGGYIVIEVRFDFGKHHFTFHTEGLRILPETLQAARVFYFKSKNDPGSFVCAISKEGTLTVMNPGSESFQVARKQVDPEYDFPIVTSATGRYEAARADGQIELSNFP